MAHDVDPELDPVSAFFREQQSALVAVGAEGPILDLACGRGRHSLAAAALGLDVLAVDRSADSLDALALAAASRTLPGRIETFAIDLESDSRPEPPARSLRGDPRLPLPAPPPRPADRILARPGRPAPLRDVHDRTARARLGSFARCVPAGAGRAAAALSGTRDRAFRGRADPRNEARPHRSPARAATSLGQPRRVDRRREPRLEASQRPARLFAQDRIVAREKAGHGIAQALVPDVARRDERRCEAIPGDGSGAAPCPGWRR